MAHRASRPDDRDGPPPDEVGQAPEEGQYDDVEDMDFDPLRGMKEARFAPVANPDNAASNENRWNVGIGWMF